MNLTTAALPEQSTAPLRVLVVDDQRDIRLLLGVVLNAPDEGLEVVADASDGPSAIEAVRALRPDVVVLDHMMPGMTGLDAAVQLLDEQPDLAIVMCSAHLTEELRRGIAAAGVRAAVDKADLRTLPQLIHEVVAA